MPRRNCLRNLHVSDSREDVSFRHENDRAAAVRGGFVDCDGSTTFARSTTRTAGRLFVGGVLLGAASMPALAHDPETAASASGLGFWTVVGLTVVLGVLGGLVVLQWHRTTTSRLSIPGFTLLLVFLGCWAGILAARQGLVIAVIGVSVGAVCTWSLRNRVAGGHHASDGAALGAVVAHRIVEGAVLTTLYAANAALGVGAALIVAGHATAETSAIVGLWSTSRWRWGVLAVVQAGFVAGALGGTVVVDPLGPLTHALVLALLGGALVAAGVAAGSRRRHGVLA